LKEAKRRKGRSKQQIAISNQSANPKSEIRSPQSVLGFRRFRPPLRALVHAEGGCPREISAWGKDKSVYGKVVSVAGPWRSSGEWWRADTWARDEWDVGVESKSKKLEARDQRSALRGQVLYRIYRELSSGIWFVEGIYD
jgi:protein ImuB